MQPALPGHGSSGLFQDRASGFHIVAPHEKLKAHAGPRYGPIHPAASVSLHGRVDAGGIEGADGDIGFLPVTERVNDDQLSLAHVPILRRCLLMEGAIIRPLSPERPLKDLEEDVMKKWGTIALALALLVGSAAPALAQFDRGSISGTIK